MNSIFKIFFRQTEDLLRLTKTTLHAYQLQNNLLDDRINLFNVHDNHPCTFAFDLCHELRLIEKNLHSTCFLLQRALYRVQALRQIRRNSLIRMDEEIVFKYEHNISRELNYIQRMIGAIIEEDSLSNSPLNSLQVLFKEIQENFDILLDYIGWMRRYKSTIYLGNLVSDTLERFYCILGTLARLAKDIEQREMK